MGFGFFLNPDFISEDNWCHVEIVIFETRQRFSFKMLSDFGREAGQRVGSNAGQGANSASFLNACQGKGGCSLWSGGRR